MYTLKYCTRQHVEHTFYSNRHLPGFNSEYCCWWSSINNINTAAKGRLTAANHKTRFIPDTSPEVKTNSLILLNIWMYAIYRQVRHTGRLHFHSAAHNDSGKKEKKGSTHSSKPKHINKSNHVQLPDETTSQPGPNDIVDVTTGPPHKGHNAYMRSLI